MIASQTNSYRIDEMLRRSEAGRRASDAARESRGPRVAGLRRLAVVASTIAMWPLRH